MNVDWDDLLRHDATHPTPQPDAMLSCPVCGVHFDSADELNEHSRESQCDQNQALDYTVAQVPLDAASLGIPPTCCSTDS